MTAEKTNEYYNFILPAVLHAGKILLEAKNVKGETKNGVDWDWVTAFDSKIENLLNNKIKGTYPEHQFIGEESATEDVSLTDDPTWIIDPIDGTENFIKKLRLSCISVGMTINKEQVFGIVYNPYMDELFTAIKGQGAYLNGERIFVSTQKGLSTLREFWEYRKIFYQLLLSDHTQSFFNYEVSMARVGDYFYNLYMFRLKHLISKIMSFRCLGSAALGLCYVACGRTDAYQCDGLYTWDAAAGTLIVREAGGYVVDSSGKAFDLLKPNFLATSTKELADQYLEIEREADIEMQTSVKSNKIFTP